MSRFHDITTVILAAGASTRMGSPKALLRLGGESFLQRLVGMHQSVVDRVVVVLGFDAEVIRAGVRLSGVRVLENPDPSRGPLSSLLTAAEHFADASALILHPVDHPLVLASTVDRLIAGHRRNPASIILPEFQGAKGHPVLFPARLFPDLRATPLSEGARGLVHRHRSQVHRVAVEDPGIVQNIDTWEDWWERVHRVNLADPLGLRAVQAAAGRKPDGG